MKTGTILPSTDNFSREDLLAAEALLQKSPADVTDKQIAMFAAYDRGFSVRAAETRRKAIAARSAPPVRTSAQAGARQKFESATGAEAAAEALLRAWETAMETGDAAAWDASVAKYEDTPVTLGSLNALAVNLLIHVNAKNRERNTRIAAIEARLTGLEARPSGGGAKWAGVFRRGSAYNDGALVTFRGSLWLALRDTTLVPGTSADDWKLVVKSGSLRDEDGR